MRRDTDYFSRKMNVFLDKDRSDDSKIVEELTKEVIFQLNVKKLCHLSILMIP